MASAQSLFESFDNLDQIDLNKVLFWLKNNPPQMFQLENYLANKILYPQTLPLSNYDMSIDLAILREALRLNGPSQKQNEMLGQNPFLNPTLRKIIIPGIFLKYVPDLVALTWAFVDGLLLGRGKAGDHFEDIWTVEISGDFNEIVGSILIPKFASQTGTLDMNVLGHNFQVKAGSLTRIPCDGNKCVITYKLSQGELLGKNNNALEVFGGELGIMVDGRMG